MNFSNQPHPKPIPVLRTKSSASCASPKSRSLLKKCDCSVCERGGRNDEARRLSISAAICDGGVTTSVRPPRRKWTLRIPHSAPSPKLDTRHSPFDTPLKPHSQLPLLPTRP